MSALAHLLGYGLPWWVWALPGLAAVVALARLAGPRAAGAAAALLALLMAYRRGAQAGFAHAQEKGDTDAEKALDAARAARADADRSASDPRRLRDDDAFRRR